MEILESFTEESMVANRLTTEITGMERWSLIRAERRDRFTVDVVGTPNPMMPFMTRWPNLKVTCSVAMQTNEDGVSVATMSRVLVVAEGMDLRSSGRANVREVAEGIAADAHFTTSALTVAEFLFADKWYREVADQREGYVRSLLTEAWLDVRKARLDMAQKVMRDVQWAMTSKSVHEFSARSTGSAGNLQVDAAKAESQFNTIVELMQHQFGRFVPVYAVAESVKASTNSSDKRVCDAIGSALAVVYDVANRVERGDR